MHFDNLPLNLLVGFILMISFYIGKTMKFIKLPSLIGYMLIGVALGPSLFNLIDHNIQHTLAFITDIALGFVALSIGLELKFTALKRLGMSIVYIIFTESFGAFLVVFTAVYFFTDNLPLALIFGAIAPASAPAGTVAVIQEYKAKGNLTKALYAVVGFDDGLGIIVFGFAAAIVRSILMNETGVVTSGFWELMLPPLKEVALSVVIGLIVSIIFAYLIRKSEGLPQTFIIIFGIVLVVTGLSTLLHLSLILTNMIIGIILVNTQPYSTSQKFHDLLPIVIPLLFVLFFTLAGANLHIMSLPALGLLGLVYIVSRSSGLIGGSIIGALIGKADKNIRKYLGMGILSQAGVAIGLSLIVKQEFQGLGKVINSATGETSGDYIGATVLTTVTATCIIFEIAGPILTKYALKKAGEIKV